MNKPHKKNNGKKKEFHKKKKNGKAYIVGDWLTDIESSSGSSDDESDDEKEKVAALVIGSSLSPLPPPPSSSTHLCLMAKGERKVQNDDNSSGDDNASDDENGSDSDEEFESPSYDDLVKLLNQYTKIIRKIRATNEKLELENDSLLAKYDIAQKASDELREENKIVSSKLKELKTSKKELREKHDKHEKIHHELTTSYNLLKDEYTTLRVNHDNLVVANEFLSNEPHDATNNVVNIDIATSCDDLIVESIEQGSSSKGKKVVESNNYDDYIKLKNENEKLKKDLEKASTTNTIMIENLDNDHNLALENEMLREENKRLKEKDLEKQSTHDELREENKKLKLEKEHLKTGLSKFTRGQYLQSELLMNTVM
jgi:chromosome segregation ATPase